MIGVAGCGRMGLPMLMALRDMGADARGFDIRDVGSEIVLTDADAFAKRLETLVIVVRDADQTEDVLFGTQNFTQRAAYLQRIILCATVSPKFVTSVRARLADEVILLDAPMSGAQHGAENRELTFMVGGPDADVDEVVPLLSAMGASLFHMGPLGSGMQAQVLNNLLEASHTAAFRLVQDWAAQSGLDQQVLTQLIRQSSGQNWLVSGLDAIEYARDGYAPDNTIGLLVKDVACAIDAAPQGSDLVLPQTIMTALRRLRPV